MFSIKKITDERPFIIAEIGQNHQGDIEIAKELITQAKLCGVDAVKSQKRDIDSLLTAAEFDRPYSSPNAFAKTYGKHRQALELSEAEYAELFEHARSIGLEFFSSPWDTVSAKLLNDLGMSFFKVPSACLTHHLLLEDLVAYKKPIIISTGMSTLDEIDAAMEILAGAPEVFLLQCTSSYPSSFASINLRVIPMYKERYPNAVIGFSGHHRGIAMDVAAVALGARVIERHFTLDRTMKGSDHAASLEPNGLARLVRDVRATEQAMGDGIKTVSLEEVPVKAKLRGERMVTAASTHKKVA